MDARQLLLEIRRRMRALQFTGTSTYVFGSSGDQFWASDHWPREAFEAVQANSNWVGGHVHLGGAEHDADDPGLIDQEIIVRLGVVHDELTTDKNMERQVVAARTGSLPAGLLQVQKEVLSSIKSLGPDAGINCSHFSFRSGAANPFPRGVTRELRFRAWITDQPTYPAARSLSHAAGTLSWVLPFSTSRFDYADLHLEYASGATAPASVGAGTEIALTKTDTSVAHGLGAGTYSFSLWSGWDTAWPLAGSADTYGAVAQLEGVSV